jgi:hypothetical protein
VLPQYIYELYLTIKKKQAIERTSSVVPTKNNSYEVGRRNKNKKI